MIGLGVAILNQQAAVSDYGPTVKPAAPFHPKQDAKRLYGAMDYGFLGWATNEDALIDILAYRSCKQRYEIADTFKSMYNINFRKFAYSEISGWFLTTIRFMMWRPYFLAAVQLK